MARSRIVGNISIEKLLAFIFGVIFLLVILGLVVFVKDLNGTARWVIVILMALAGAGFAAVIPGILNITTPYIKSGGALAVFVLIMANQPNIIGQAKKIISSKDSTLAIAEYLKKIDDNQLDAAWDSLDDGAKETVASDKQPLRSAYQNGRASLGSLISRSPPMGTNAYFNPPGFPEGAYRVVTYRTRFSGGCHQEAVSVRSLNDGDWRVFNHVVDFNVIPCDSAAVQVGLPLQPTAQGGQAVP